MPLQLIYQSLHPPDMDTVTVCQFLAEPPMSALDVIRNLDSRPGLFEQVGQGGAGHRLEKRR